MRPFAIAGIQMEVRDDDRNVHRMRASVEDVARHFPWVQMVVFSELAACGQNVTEAQALPGPLEATFADLARQHGLWFVSGSVYERVGEQVFNTTSVFGPEGQLVGRYRKMFPFRPYEAGVTAGTKPLVFDVPEVGRFGLSICYDLWIPETVRWLVSEGAEVILHPSLTETIDRDVELAIVRATAACFQCYVVDVNGVAEGGNGRSTIVGPAADVIYTAGTSPQQIPVEIDLDRVSRTREVGVRGLGQPLKSFRDRAVEFPIYEPGRRSPYLESLGPLRMPERGSRAGVGARPSGPPAVALERTSDAGGLKNTGESTGPEPPVRS